MRVLIVKLSSLGDVIHTLPALSDAKRAHPAIHFDWVVEENFAAIPGWHAAVSQVIPVAIRRWRKNWRKAWASGEIRAFWRQLRDQRYDAIIDPQGLLKSAVLGFMAHGRHHGYDKHSIRSPGLSWLYHRRYAVSKTLHAVERIRQLFAQTLAYDTPSDRPDYGIAHLFTRPAAPSAEVPYLVFLHATTWPSKQWPEAYWQRLATTAAQAGFQIKLNSGNDEEYARAQRIAAVSDAIEALPRRDLPALGQLIANAHGVVSVDTGLGHLAAALGVTTVALYGATNPTLTATYGANQQHLNADFPCAPCLQRNCQHPLRHQAISPPCYQALTPERVWAAFKKPLPN